ncbi:hypothetical protein B0J14DRAFT_24247 [Halenospora varia]|nr:hypothetical protein B0J14DRAFT_24247 [Halenospora varia]
MPCVVCWGRNILYKKRGSVEMSSVEQFRYRHFQKTFILTVKIDHSHRLVFEQPIQPPEIPRQTFRPTSKMGLIKLGIMAAGAAYVVKKVSESSDKREQKKAACQQQSYQDPRNAQYDQYQNQNQYQGPPAGEYQNHNQSYQSPQYAPPQYQGPSSGYAHPEKGHPEKQQYQQQQLAQRGYEEEPIPAWAMAMPEGSARKN